MRRVLAVGALGIGAILVWTFVVAPMLGTPEREVARYLAATSAGNEQEALDAWPAFVGGIHPRPALLARRAEVTHELASIRVGRGYRVTSTEWWRTCCEPGRIDDPRNAGLARMHVTAMDADGKEHKLVFSVFVEKIAWWGDAAGERVKKWRLYEVHREGETCVFPSSAYGCG
jgi:hypothetical protein